jgi:putative restriction endonuclease
MATGGQLSDLTSASAVLQAMAEFRRLGRDAFIEKYSVSAARFRKSDDYFVYDGSIGYDSKPLVAAAYGFQHGRKHALHSDDFYGGDPVKARMRALGYQVVHWTSAALVTGKIYTREQLRQRFEIEDATLNTGVFRPSGTNSIWLFVTRDKTSDRTQYHDRLEGDRLYWQGQTQGRTDVSIIEHEANGDEILIFFRESKRQYAGAGFRFEGRFRHVSHKGSKPTNFILQRWTAQDDAVLPEDDFDPDSVKDGREKIWAQVKRRQGQPAFRRKLLRAYGGVCAVTGCTIEALLEAAHIHPYRGEDTNIAANGLLLRADIHTLFDCGLIAIGDDHSILVSHRLIGTEYEKLGKDKLAAPLDVGATPSDKALSWHRVTHGFA